MKHNTIYTTDALKNFTVLITGSSGFIGFHLARYLLKQGISVLGYDNMNSYYDPSLKEERLKLLEAYPTFQFFQDDLSDSKALDKVFANYSPDIVINLAAQAGVRYSIENPDSYIQSNIIGFYNILECCRNYPIKHLVYASSSSVYGSNKKIPFSTNDKTDTPVSLYAATKKSNELMAYSYCNLYHFPATGLRFFTVYGPYGRPDMAYFSFTQKIYKNEPIKIFNNGDMYRDFTYIDDIIKGIVNVMKKTPEEDENGTAHKVYNIGNNKPEKLMDFINTLEDCIGKKAKKEYYPMQPGDVYQTYADVTDLIHDFSFYPDTPLKEGLTKFIDWYKNFYL